MSVHTDDEPKFEKELDVNLKDDYAGIYDSDTVALIRKNWTAIRTFMWNHKLSKVYNLRIVNNSLSSTLESSNISSIFLDQTLKFKINAAIGSILVSHVNEKLRYWHASANHDKLFDQPQLIETRDDYEEFINNLSSKDFIESAARHRPDTTWSLHCLTNITLFVYPIQDHPIGHLPAETPVSKTNKAIVSALTDSNGKPYTDNLCLFRALSLMRGNRSTLESSTRTYFQRYIQSQCLSAEEFKGVSLGELPFVENEFQVSISIFTLSDDVSQMVYRSVTKHKERLNLHLEDSHFSWIKNLKLYTKSYKCSFCPKLVKSAAALKHHSLSCSSTTTNFVYPYGAYKPHTSIFDKLREIGISVDESRKYYPYYAVFDAESYQSTEDLPKNTATIAYETKHKLASVSVCSNVAGFVEPVCFVNDTDSEYCVVDQMMTYLDTLSDLCYKRLSLRYAGIFRRLKRKKECAVQKEKLAGDATDVFRLERYYDALKDELDRYLRDIPVFGFNSGRYDIPLIKSHLLSYIKTKNGDVKYVIRKGNNYMCLQTTKLRFLDICNYLAPGFSYDSYLKAMEVDCQKFFWIHDKFTSLDILKSESFPAHEDFYSRLKQQNITEDQYAYCKKVWVEQNMKSLRDLLIYYNNCDVKGFVDAIRKQCEFFRTRGLDMKSAISIPGLAIQYLFQCKDTEAPILMFGKKNSDLYELVKSQIRGGLSMVYSRWQQVDKTKIKPEIFGASAKTTQSCEGQDISGMYLSNLCRLMPTGPFIRRRKENGFRLERCYQHSEKAVEWIKWFEKTHGIRVQHCLNDGERRIGGRNLPVDGYARLENGKEIILQFSGCWYHSHMCKIAPKGKCDDLAKDIENKLTTLQNLRYLEKLGYEVHHMWECQFRGMKANDAELKDFCKNLNVSVDHRYLLSEDQILKDIRSGDLFGMVECDIETPEDLKNIFAEFQPIAKHAYLSRSDIGEHMKSYCEKHNLLKKPTKTLLCSYFGKKMLFATPLLQWYLNHGLKITKIYQVIQYKPSACFESFGDEIMEARREGDKDTSKKILSDSAKLIGL